MISEDTAQPVPHDLAAAVTEALRKVHDPEMMISIVDLGLIYDVLADQKGNIHIKMTLTTPACPYGPLLLESASKAAQSVTGVSNVKIALVWDPPWDPAEMASDEAKDRLGLW